jgi:hypothetical protein
MGLYTIALFGEAEKGDYNTPYFCHTLNDLITQLGSPPENSRGLTFAIQAILYHRNLIFLRVQEEGFSTDDYFAGLKVLRACLIVPKVNAIYMPGVGEEKILREVKPLCHIMITNGQDFYDYMTEKA